LWAASGRCAHDLALGVPVVDEGQLSEGLRGDEGYASNDDGAMKEVVTAATFAFGAAGTLADGAPGPLVELHLCDVGLSGGTVAHRYYGRRGDTGAPLFSPCWRNQVPFQRES
jgi:hypothetical protein